MCGIAGVLNLLDRPPVDPDTVLGMLGMIQHRGPDGAGLYRDAHVGLGHARLSVIDLADGDQPIRNESGALWIVFNGEIFNYVELRRELEARGHQFATRSDTEVIVHLYEDLGPRCLSELNGQFAIAIWDAVRRELFLARDRLGVRPLFYTEHDGRLVFGSEIKAILAHPGQRAEIDPLALEQIFTFWTALAPRTAFRDIVELPPGHYLIARPGHRLGEPAPYWQIDFQEPAAEPDGPGAAFARSLEELEALLIDAIRLRLRSDVPVGAYVSGGLDSSIIAALIRRHTGNPLETFSIVFTDDPERDESRFQRRITEHLGTAHQEVECAQSDIGRVFPSVVWHTETPVLRTAPAPMFLLSGLVNSCRYKVVLTGEGADELLGGYDIFKEMAIRRFWARRPESRIRPLLLQRLYADIPGLGGAGLAYRAAFFKKGLTDTGSPIYSHAIRWSTTTRIRRFLRSSGQAAPGLAEMASALCLPPSFPAWPALAQAQYLEITVFLSRYLLSSQGDRVAMAHSVEGRYPFLDHRVVDFCNRLPSRLKLSGMTDKWLLRQLGRALLPEELWQRPKRPYRAPIRGSFFGARAPDYVDALLSERSLREDGTFDPASVAQLARKARSEARLSEVEDMAIVGILSTLLTRQLFITSFRKKPLVNRGPIKTIDALAGRTP